jgi:hypothetical protein
MRLAVVVSALVAVALLVLAAPSARAATTCQPPDYPGTGYFTSLKVTHTSCTTGKKFVVAYYKCRLKHGKAGRCTSKVMGYSCKETRETIPTEIDARVTCKDGSKQIVHTYQQNT